MQYAPQVRTGRRRIRSRHDAEPEIQHPRRGHSTWRERTAEKPKAIIRIILLCSLVHWSLRANCSRRAAPPTGAAS